MKFDAWNDFESGDWQSEINVRDFIQKNYILMHFFNNDLLIIVIYAINYIYVY